MINYILIIILLIIILSNTIYCENFDNKDDSDKKSKDSFDKSKIEDQINNTISEIDDNLEKLKESDAKLDKTIQTIKDNAAIKMSKIKPSTNYKMAKKSKISDLLSSAGLTGSDTNNNTGSSNDESSNSTLNTIIKNIRRFF